MNKKIHLIKAFTDINGCYAVESVRSFGSSEALERVLKSECRGFYAELGACPGSVFQTRHNPLRFAWESGEEARRSMRHVRAVEICWCPGDGNPGSSSEVYLIVSSKYLKHFVRKNQEYLRNVRKYAAFAA